MKFIEGHDRTQTHLFPVSLDKNHEIRLIELFVDSVNLEDFSFKSKLGCKVKSESRSNNTFINRTVNWIVRY